MTALKYLQPLVGQIVLTNDRIYLYKERIWLEPSFPVIVLATSETAAAVRPAAAAGPAAAGSSARAGAELLYPDGRVRWTAVIMGSDDIIDSLRTI